MEEKFIIILFDAVLPPFNVFSASQVIHTTPRRPNINIDNDGYSIARGDAKKTRREHEGSNKKTFLIINSISIRMKPSYM